MTEPLNSKGRAPALDKGLDIIEFMVLQHDPKSLYEIAEGLGRTRGEVYRMLNCLVDRGYLERVGETEKLVLSDKLFGLAQKHVAHADVFKLAQSKVDQICLDTGCSFSLSVRSSCYSVTVYNAVAQSRLTIVTPIGVRIELWKSASGRALLMRATDEELRYIQSAASKIEDIDLTSIVSASNCDEGVCSVCYPTAPIGIELATCISGEAESGSVAISCVIPGELSSLVDDITGHLKAIAS